MSQRLLYLTLIFSSTAFAVPFKLQPLGSCDFQYSKVTATTFLADEVSKDVITYEERVQELAQIVNSPQVTDGQISMSKALRIASHAALVYCDSDQDARGLSGFQVDNKNWFTGNYNIEKHASVDGYRTALKNENDLQYLITSNEAEKEIIVAFRGSVNYDNWIANLDLGLHELHELRADSRFQGGMCPLPETGNIQVRNGFLSTLPASALSAIITEIEALQAKHPGFSVVVTGHSLGAALAALFAVHWRVTGHELAALYTFAQPIVGSLEFNNWMADCITPEKYLRFTSSNDLVPWVTFRDDFAHADNVREVYFPNTESLDYKVCLGGKDQECSRRVPCNDQNWNYHSKLGLFWINKGICLIGQGPGSTLDRSGRIQKAVTAIETTLNQAKNEGQSVWGQMVQTVKSWWP